MTTLDATQEAKTLCGHDDAPAKFSDLSGASTICQPCYALAKRARDDYLLGRTGMRATQAALIPLFGPEARAYCRSLRWARLRIRLHLARR